MNNRQYHIRLVFWAAITVLLPSNMICIQYSPIDDEEFSDCTVVVTKPNEYFDHSLKSQLKIEPLTIKWTNQCHTNLLTNHPASAYEYHVKTVAIIGGSNPLITLKDIFNPTLSDNVLSVKNDDHLRPRRSVNSSFVDETTTLKSEPVFNDISSLFNWPTNITLFLNSSSSSSAAKDLTKRSFYPSHQTSPQSEMTQAIMEENPVPSEVYTSHHPRSFDHTSSSGIGNVEEQHNIEEFFRKNVPIYDGVPIARQGYHHSSADPLPKKFQHFTQSLQDEEEEEEDGKPMKGLLEVHPDADMEYEYVPMKINKFGKQIVMEGEAGAEDEVDEQPSYPYHPSSNYYSESNLDHDSGLHSRPALPLVPSSHSYPFDNSHLSQFKSSPNYYLYNDYSPPLSSFTDESPIKYGTSHQYNSFADQQPRYYKHFKPSIPYPTHDEVDYPSSPHSSPSQPVEYSSQYYNNVVPKKALSSRIQGSFANSYPTRSTHVPQTLEEYHRLHSTFDTSKKFSSKPFSQPIIVSQDDKNKEEDEEEEKDKDTADYSHGPKSFVSLNFGTTGTSGESEDGVSIRHEIGHHLSPRRPYFKPAAITPADGPDHQEFPVEYSAETVSGPLKYNDELSPGSIEAYVDSVFKKNNYRPDIVVGKTSNSRSPYNPNFGDRVEQRVPKQSILWHRKGSFDGPVTRDKHSQNKNDRLLHEENIKMYDRLVKEVTLKPAKRTKFRNDQSRESKSDELPSFLPEETEPSQDEVNQENEEEEEPQFSYWSQSSSEPN